MKESLVDVAPIILTDGAVNQLRVVKESQNLGESLGVRVGVKGGGCSGFSYVLGFDEKQADDDEFIISGMKVYMKKAHALQRLVYNTMKNTSLIAFDIHHDEQRIGVLVLYELWTQQFDFHVGRLVKESEIIKKTQVLHRKL